MQPLAASSLTRLLAFAAALAAPTAAQAGVEAIQAEDNSAWIAAGASHLDYTETGDGGFNLDTERGVLPALSAGISLLGGSNAYLPPRLYLALDVDSAFGDLRYRGGLLLSGAPFEGTTTETIWSIRGRVGYAFPVGTETMLIPYVQLGYRDWNREFSSVQQEHYHNIEATGGLLAQYSPTPKAVFSLWGAAGASVSGGMTAINPKMHFDLGDRAAWTAGAKAGYRLGSHLELFTRVTYDRLSYGRSQDVLNPLDGFFYYEPKSRTEAITTQIGIAYTVP